MDEDKKKILIIVIAVVCLIAAGMVLKSTFSSSKHEITNEPVWILCTNAKCKSQYSLEQDEFQRLMKGDNRIMSLSGPFLKCSKCGKRSAHFACKCIDEHCGFVFMPDNQTSGYPDKCPKCGTSAIEQRLLR